MNEHNESRRFDGMWVDREIAALSPLASVPTEALEHRVRVHGQCMNDVPPGEPPDPPASESQPDRWLAELMCRGCPVRRKCLEAELRASGEHTVGVWGGLTDDDRRSLVAQWEAHPERRHHEPDAAPPIAVLGDDHGCSASHRCPEVRR